jgi:hypothetical protein
MTVPPQADARDTSKKVSAILILSQGNVYVMCILMFEACYENGVYKEGIILSHSVGAKLQPAKLRVLA